VLVVGLTEPSLCVHHVIMRMPGRPRDLSGRGLHGPRGRQPPLIAAITSSRELAPSAVPSPARS
jgi:hypothetical protein